MAYEKYTWVTGETITAELLNNMEQGIEDASEPQAVTWSEIADKPATFAPTIGTTATTAKAGDYQPTWAQVSGKPTTFAPEIGSTADTAAAGNHTHNNYATVTALNALTARVEALENLQD